MTKMADKQKKDNFFKKIATYLKATKSELKKVTWPSKKQLINNTGVVIACVAVVGVIIFILNYIFSVCFGFLTNNKVEVEDATDYTEMIYEDEVVDIEMEAVMATDAE